MACETAARGDAAVVIIAVEDILADVIGAELVEGAVRSSRSYVELSWFSDVLKGEESSPVQGIQLPSVQPVSFLAQSGTD